MQGHASNHFRSISSHSNTQIFKDSHLPADHGDRAWAPLARHEIIQIFQTPEHSNTQTLKYSNIHTYPQTTVTERGPRLPDT